MTPIGDGPFLQLAAFCEKVLKEDDGVLSLVRIIDRITHASVAPDSGSEMPPVPVEVTMVLAFKAGVARGSSTVSVQPRAPSGLTMGSGVDVPVLFESEDRGANIVIPIRFVADQQGVYWFEVRVDGAKVTQMPLRVVYQRLAVGS